MRFCKFLKIMNCYIGQEKSQYDFMYVLFSNVVCEPFSEEDMKRDEKDEYYPFSKLCSESNAKKVYSGERTIPKSLARFVHSHFDPTCLIDLIYDMSDEVKGNLCTDLVSEGIECNLDNVANVVADSFKLFVSAALDEIDTIETQTKTECTVRAQSENATNLEVLLLEEVANACPICGCKLLRKNKKNVVKKYKAVQIFPETLNREDFLKFNKVFSINGNYYSDENLITLCIDCAIDYESEVSFDNFKKMIKIKKDLASKQIVQQRLEAIDIEGEIGYVINALIDTTKEDKFTELSLHALRVEQKIYEKYGIMINSISNDVVHYYKFIEEQFRNVDSYQSNSFERIAGEVKLAFEKMEGNGLAQNQIYDELVEWMLRKIEFDGRYRRAAEIVISFFVQNCEVFREISK